MITAAAATQDQMGGLTLGADYYLPRPFDFQVLVARIGAPSAESAHLTCPEGVRCLGTAARVRGPDRLGREAPGAGMGRVR